MDKAGQSDEQSVLNQVRKVIEDLMRFDKASQIRRYRTVGTFFGFDDRDPYRWGKTDIPAALLGAAREPYFSSPSEPPIKEFLSERRPSTDVDRVACLAYYLSHYRDNDQFKTTDIGLLNSEAGQVKLRNPSAALNSATRAGLLATATGGRRRLTEQGEKYVEALPGRRKARQFRSQSTPAES